MIAALAKAIGRRAPAASRQVDEAAMSRARQWGMSKTYHGRAPGPVQGENLRPSPNGVYGPGIYTDDVAENAARYGDNVEELMASDKLAPVKVFDETVRRMRAAGAGDQAVPRAVEELRKQGYEGVRDGTVRAVWSPRDVRSVDARFETRDSGNMMAGLGGLALGGAAFRNEFDR